MVFEIGKARKASNYKCRNHTHNLNCWTVNGFGYVNIEENSWHVLRTKTNECKRKENNNDISSFSIFLLCVCVFCPKKHFFRFFYIYTYICISFNSIQTDLSRNKTKQKNSNFLDRFWRIFIHHLNSIHISQNSIHDEPMNGKCINSNLILYNFLCISFFYDLKFI